MERVSLIVVTYNHREVIGPCLRALDEAALDPASTRLLIVDNAQDLDRPSLGLARPHDRAQRVGQDLTWIYAGPSRR